MRKSVLLIVLGSILFWSCRDSKTETIAEDHKAKEMFQGLWVMDENGGSVLLAKGDSISFPDSASVPVHFWINSDSIFLKGRNVNSYKIIKQSENVFRMMNKNGEEVTLVKSDNKNLLSDFKYHAYAMNTFLKESSDTLVKTEAGYFQSEVFCQTSSERVIKPTFNDLGIEVDNVYLDNTARLNITNGGKLIYSHEFKKQEFQSMIDKAFLERSILKRFVFNRTDLKALYYDAMIGIPDAATSYVIEVRITTDGKVTTRMT